MIEKTAKRIAVLGSTGSIGRQTLDCIWHMDDAVCFALCAGGSNIDLLNRQIAEFKPRYVGICSAEKAGELILPEDCILIVGTDAASMIARLPEVDTVVNGISGFDGLVPLLSAIEADKTVASANKESIVCGHSIVDKCLKAGRGCIIPVDSEQSAIFQCLMCADHAEVKKLILTASGGAFKEYTYEQLQNVTYKDALKHPTWSMGTKITIDSASMFNKGLEIMEAAYLFDVSGDNIDVLVHPQSIVHSMVEFNDGCVMALLAVPDMRLAIQYGIMYPKRQQRIVSTLELAKIGALTFEKPDKNKYRAIDLAYLALKADGVMPIAYNAANEVAVDEFIKGRIKFLEIADIVEETLEESARLSVETDTIEGIICADMEARRLAADSVSRICANRR